MACADGHTHLVQLFLNFSYPEYVRKIFKEAHGDRMCRLGIAINARDGHGHTPLHRAVFGNHLEIVEMLLSFQAPVLFHYKEGVIENLSSTVLDGGQEAEMANTVDPSALQTEMFCPVEVDSIDLEGNTALHLAVMSESSSGDHHKVAELLLEHGANPNKPIITSSGNSTALMLACKKMDSKMLDLLLRHRAVDDGQKVLKAAVDSQREDLISAFLQHRSHADVEYKINLMALLQEYHEKGDWSPNMESAGSVTLKSIWPNVAVMLNWYGVGFTQVSPEWMVRSCVPHNGRPSSVDVRDEILFNTITRIDISNNLLQQLPLAIFQLSSLRILNVENNKLQVLPSAGARSVSASQATNTVLATKQQGVAIEPDSSVTTNTESSAAVFEEDVQWCCPLLEEINLNKNRLSTLPAQLFKLPMLRRLTVSNNAIQSLPFDMWKAPMLVELNLSSNKLRSLPHSPQSNSQSMANFDAGHYDIISLASTVDSPANSVPNTPKKSTTADQQQIFEFDAIDSPRASPDKYYQDLPVTRVSHWQGRLKVRPVSNYQDMAASAQQQSKLTELNLGRNNFESVPTGLACLAPGLVKLVMAHNKLSHIGSLANYPSGLRILDVSHNVISGETTRDQLAIDEDRGLVCFSPHHQAKHVRRSVLNAFTTSLKIISGSVYIVSWALNVTTNYSLFSST